VFTGSVVSPVPVRWELARKRIAAMRSDGGDDDDGSTRLGSYGPRYRLMRWSSQRRGWVGLSLRAGFRVGCWVVTQSGLATHNDYNVVKKSVALRCIPQPCR
jgi:hypothetical protein